jgi:hypothetical protein
MDPRYQELVSQGGRYSIGSTVSSVLTQMFPKGNCSNTVVERAGKDWINDI